MPYILVNTHIFNRFGGVYKDVYECFIMQDDVIAYTNEILKEYDGRAIPSKLTLRGFIQELENMGKLVFFRKSYVEARIRRHERTRRVHYPQHNKDRKWIKTAIAIRARYILSSNQHLTRLPPNRNNGNYVEVIEPPEYLQIRCPN